MNIVFGLEHFFYSLYSLYAGYATVQRLRRRSRQLHIFHCERYISRKHFLSGILWRPCAKSLHVSLRMLSLVHRRLHNLSMVGISCLFWDGLFIFLCGYFSIIHLTQNVDDYQAS